MSMVKHARRLDGTVVPVALAQLYWPDIDEGIIPEAHIRQEVFEGCDIVLFSQVEFDAFQGTLAQIHEKVKRISSKKGLDDSFRWHKHTNYSESFLHSQGFGTLTKSTLVAVDNGTGRFEIAFLFLREKSIDGAAMKDLCDYLYRRNRPGKRARGDSFVQDRGDKTICGKMDAFGSWDAYGPASVGLGKGKMEVRSYNPNGPIDATLNAKVLAHVDQLTAMEKDLAPSCAALRAIYSELLDPYRNHRMSPNCDAFAMSTSINYIADPHDDSGARGLLEFIQFVNASGPLPPGHKWLFAIAGFMCELPTAVGESAIIALPACGVYHGTMPTSSTTATHQHGNYGSALITKKPICEGLRRQLQCGRATHPRYRSSNLYFNGAAERPEFTCEHCRVFEGTKEEVEEHEECCELKP